MPLITVTAVSMPTGPRRGLVDGERLKSLSGLPTPDETGLKDFEFGVRHGI